MPKLSVLSGSDVVRALKNLASFLSHNADLTSNYDTPTEGRQLFLNTKKSGEEHSKKAS